MPPTHLASRPAPDEARWQFDDWLALSFSAFLFLTPPLLLALCVYAYRNEAAQAIVAVPAAALVIVSLYLSRASTRRRCR